MGYSRQEYWSGLPYSLPGSLPNPGLEPVSLMSPALAGGSLLLANLGSPSKEHENTNLKIYMESYVHHSFIYKSQDMKTI